MEHLREALRRIATSPECGCTPVCQCRANEALEIEIGEMRGIAAEALSLPNGNGWKDIKDLPDRIDTQIILWNPCDGIHLADACATERETDELRSGAVFTHWMRIERPKVQK